MSTTTFRGYAVDLLMSLKAHGRALVGNDDLYDAAQAYTDPTKGSGVFGPALLDVAPQLERRRAIEPTVAVDEEEDPVDEDDDRSPWDTYDLITLRDILKANNVEFPRTMTKGSAIKRLDAAHITPPT